MVLRSDVLLVVVEEVDVVFAVAAAMACAFLLCSDGRSMPEVSAAVARDIFVLLELACLDADVQTRIQAVQSACSDGQVVIRPWLRFDTAR